MATSERTVADTLSKNTAGGVESAGVVNRTMGNHNLPKDGPMQAELPGDALAQAEGLKVMRKPITMQPVSPQDLMRIEDARWASHDPDVLAHYCGEFVVPYERKVVAHGTEASAVLAEAARITGWNADELPLVGVMDPLVDIPPGGAP